MKQEYKVFMEWNSFELTQTVYIEDNIKLTYKEIVEEVLYRAMNELNINLKELEVVQVYDLIEGVEIYD